MLGIFKWIWSGIAAFGKALVLPFTEVNQSSKWKNVIRWSIHFLCVVGVLAGLGYLNQKMHLDTVLRAPAVWLRAAWLPLLAFQIYLLSWLGWWLCRTATTIRDDSEHRDLERTWNSVQASLELASIDIKQTPVFLMLGKPSQAMASFFHAGQVAQKIPVLPKDADAPFHLYANDEAIYLCLEETSLLGRQASMIKSTSGVSVHSKNRSSKSHAISAAQRGSAHDFPPSAVDNMIPPAKIPLVEASATGSTSARRTQMATATAVQSLPTDDVAPGESAHEIEARSLDLIAENIALAEEVDAQPESIGRAKIQRSGVYQAAKPTKMPILQDELEIETTLSRLEVLCKLVHEARHPFCPINGVVVLIPFAASENQEIANHVGMLIEQDLETVRTGTMVEAAKIAIVCDLQNATGCVDVLSRFPVEQQHRRLGIKFPKVPSCESSQYRQMIADGLNWLCLKMVPPLINRLFSFETAVNGNTSGECEANRQLYRFTQVLRERHSKIERLIRRAFLGNHGREGLLRGVYFSASGNDSVHEHGFTAGIFDQIAELQSDISWTPEAIDRNRDFDRWTWFGYAGIATVVLVVLACVVL